MPTSKVRLTNEAYTVGWISALPLEMAAAIAMLDASHTPLPRPKGDNNTYHLGEIGDHNIVIACLPTGIYGLTSAAVVANQMLITFPSIEFGLMVGIGGGAPSKSADIRLGDIVVSKPTDGFPGVIQYDYGKTLAGGVFHRTGTLNNPPQMLLTAISDLQAKHRLGDNRIPTHLATAAKGHPSMSQSFIYPRATKDILFEPSYNHRNNHASCTSCSLSETVSRPPRTSTVPRIHYGLIASANQVMKDAQTRDRVGKELGILCYEMEAAGLMNHFPSLVIRGICDYSDSHKDKIWQDYAAATAAAYARELLQSSLRGRCTIPPTSMRGTIRSKIPLSKSVFFGREMELKQVRQVLNLTIRARQTAVIWGLSGYGKTQLALEYITAQRAQYDSILWIDSSSRGMIEQSFENISSQLPPNTRNEGPAVERVLGWLEQGTNSSWIMVLDGVESLDDNDSIDDLDIRTFFPSCDHGHILLVTTSRDLHLRLGFPDIAVQNVDDQTGAEILMACAGGKPGDSSPKSKAMVISRKLGGMPLAIQQAGSFLSYGMISMSDYTQQFQMRYLDKTLKTPLRKYVGSYEKGRTLWTTFDILYRALAQRSWDSVRLLSLAAFLGRGQIPFSTIFREGVNQGETWERLCAVSTQGEPKGPMVELAELLQWLMELRSDIDRVALAVRELEGSGFISFHRSAGDTAIDSFAIHDLARSFIQSKAPQERAFDILATSFLISGLQLYDGCNMPSEALVRKHMGRLIGVLDLFLAGIPGHTLEPPDGQYFALCAAVSPMYARICRYQGKLDTAAHLWKIALQYRFILDTGQPKRDVDLQDHMEAADIDARLGHFEDAIDKYSLVVTWSKDCHSQDDELAIRAAGYLRQVRERYEQHKQDLDRAVIAHSAPKAVLQDLSDDLDIGNYEWELKANFQEAANLFGPVHSETLEHAERLAAFYRSNHRYENEKTYREMIWGSRVQRHGDSPASTPAALQALYSCYYEGGELQSKICQNFCFARVWAEEISSSTLVALFGAADGPAIYESLLCGDKYIIQKLLDSGELETAICWISLLPVPVRNRSFQYVVEASTTGEALNLEFFVVKLISWHFTAPAIEMLLDMGANVHNTDDYGETALHLAVAAGNQDIVRVLLSRGANISHGDSCGRAAIHFAAMEDDSSLVIFLLDLGASVDHRDNLGRTPLHMACNKGELSAVYALLARGADIFATTADGQAPIHIAADNGYVLLFSSLFERGASILQTDGIGRTALHYAAGRSWQDYLITLVIDALAKELGDVPSTPETVDQYREIINLTDASGQSALDYAVAAANTPAVEALISAGADTQTFDQPEEASVEDDDGSTGGIVFSSEAGNSTWARRRINRLKSLLKGGGRDSKRRSWSDL